MTWGQSDPRQCILNTQRHHCLPGDRLGSAVRVFIGALLCLSSGPDSSDLVRNLEVSSPPIICSPRWAHPKGPEAAQIPWTSSSVHWCFPVLRGPPFSAHCCTDTWTHISLGSASIHLKPLSPFTAVEQGPSLSPTLGAFLSCPLAVPEEKLCPLALESWQYSGVGEGLDKAFLCPRCLQLPCKA